MASLPQSVGMAAPNSVTPQAAPVDTGSLDRGLQTLAGGIERYNQGLDVAADREAETLETGFVAEYSPALEARMADYDGTQEGFSRAEIAAFDQAAQAWRSRADVPPRVQKALNRRLDARKGWASTTAIQFEVSKRGKVAIERRSQVEAADDLRAYPGLYAAGRAAVKAVQDQWDGKSAGLSDAGRAAWEAATQPLLAALPEAQRLRLGRKLLSDGAAVYSDLMAKEDKGQTLYVLNTANAAAESAAKMVLADPDEIAKARSLITDAAVLVPGPVREDWTKAAMTKAVMARFSGLIDAGQLEVARDELAALVSDEAISAEDFGRIQVQIARGGERKAADDVMAKAEVDSQWQAYFDGLAPRPDEDVTAAAVGQAGLDRYRLKDREVQAMKADLGDLSLLTNEGFAQRMAGLGERAVAAAGTGDYALRKEVLTTADALWRDEVKARQDGAQWAMSNARPGHPSYRVANAWAKAQQDDDPGTRALALDAYANNTIALQRSVGLTATLLPKAVAKGAVATVLSAPDDKARGDALVGLSAQLSLWGQHRGMVMDDLMRAGLPADAGVVVAELGDDVAGLRAYAAGGTEMKTWKAKDRDDWRVRVQKALAPLDATVVGGAGSAQTRQARYEAVGRTAAGYQAQGMSADAAVRRAAKAYVDDYVFTSTYRIPREVAARKVTGISDVPGSEEFAAGGLTLNGDRAITWAIAKIRRDLTPDRLADNLSEGREKSDRIRQKARVVTRDDDSGLELKVQNDLDGTWSTVTTKDGKAQSYSWAELETIAQRSK